MTEYTVYYRKDPTFHSDKNLTLDNLLETHVQVVFVKAPDMDKVFEMMQGEVWSPNR